MLMFSTLSFFTFWYFYFENVRCEMLKNIYKFFKKIYIYFQVNTFITINLLVYKKTYLFI